MINYELLGARIRELRQEKGMTQQQVADKSGISTAFYGHIERGTRKASIETVVAISNALDSSVDELLRDSLNIYKIQFEGFGDERSQKRVLKDAAQVLLNYFNDDGSSKK